MAPKTKRGREKFDATRFSSAKAEERYTDALESRKIIPERSFLNPGGAVERVIVDRAWEKYCYFSSVAVISLVREFYANLPDIDDGHVFLRGQKFLFMPDVINIFCQTIPSGTCSFSGFSPSDDELDEIIRYLTNGNGHWKERNGRKVNFSSTHLTAESKAWHYFISARLLPSGHVSEVTKDRAILSHCIQTLRPVDVGRIVFQSAMNSARANTSSGFGFPGLIYALCQQAGIYAEAREEVIHPLQSISRSMLHTYGRIRPESGSSSRPAPSRPSTASASTSAAADPEPTNSEVMSRLDKFHHDVWNVQGRLHAVEHHLSHFDHFYKLQADYYRTQDPSYPEYPAYVPPPEPYTDIIDSDEEE